MSNKDLAEMIDIAFAIVIVFGSILWFILYHKLDKIYDELKEIRKEKKEKKEVKHGHYKGVYDGYADGNPVYDIWYCSECNYYFEDWDEKPTYNFCPNCGAEMRERRETE